MKTILIVIAILCSFTLAQEEKKHPLRYEKTIQGVDFEDVKILFRSALEGLNMNVLGVVDISTEKPRFSYFLVCNLSYAEKIFREFPQLGVMSPCRVYLYEKEDGSVVVGFVNVETLLKLFGEKLSPEARKVFRRADSDIKTAIREVEGK